MRADDRGAACDPRDGGCRLCADEGVPARVLVLHAASRTATVSLGDGTRATVAMDLVDAAVGDTLLVHMGFALARLEGNQ